MAETFTIFQMSSKTIHTLFYKIYIKLQLQFNYTTLYKKKLVNYTDHIAYEAGIKVLVLLMLVLSSSL